MTGRGLLHGGALDAAVARYGGARADWLDLSTGINPVATPHAPPPSGSWTRLPEAGAERALEEAARRAYGVPDALAVLPVPGTQAALQMLPRLYPSCDVAVVSPTYTEHARCWALAAHRVRAVPEPTDADVLVACNPNNPDGRDREPADLVDRGRRLTVIDEAFRDATPGRSAVPLAGERTLVLKSLGKFHGLAGARLGHVIGPPALVDPLRDALGPWAVSGPALHVGRSVLESDPAPIVADIRARSRRLLDLLHALGVPVVGATELFALTAWVDAGAAHEALARERILARRFEDRNDWLRLGLPPDDGFDRLRGALERATAAP